MNYFYLGNDFNEDVAKSLLEKIEASNELTIYLSSNGGQCYASEAMLDALNENHKRINIKVVGDLTSNAFWIFFNFKGKREILGHSTGIYHYCGSKRRIMENGRMEYADEKLMAKEDKRRIKLSRQWCLDLGFNKAEMRKMESGDTLFFGYDRLNELLKNQK